ncbi:MAG: L-lactate dehydrogenase [Gemmatimonadaceae bacterium]|nr:L-lactate dehydrogenase [Gemmatimonadaceae bacterium]
MTRETVPDSIAIIGCGHVGSTSAYALMLRGVARDLVLLDANHAVAEAEAMDLQHAVPMGRPVRIRAGDYGDAARAGIVIIAAGVGGKPGESRLELLERNIDVVRECMTALSAEGFMGIVLMATNPVDALAQVAYEQSGFPASRVIGSGTVLDSARLRAMLGEDLGVEARSIHAYVIGEHGDSEIIAWSSASVAGVPLLQYARDGQLADPGAVLHRVRQAAPDIIRSKGFTSFAIASCVTRICEAIIRDEHSVLPVSTLLTGQYGISGVYLSLPCVVGRAGVERVIDIPLDVAEHAGLHQSAGVLQRALQSVRHSSTVVRPQQKMT